ncbi:MAG: M23 family metallopeptidase [FCB group bacterium]|nr:M23 family metallopeptidase [FCB group bacterium]
MGLDLRTGGKAGAKVFACENGYVWRIKTGYRGYGKALYIKGESGKLYVFGHLQTFNWDIGTYLRQHQLDSLRYYQDIYPDPIEFPIKKGDFIARTGQTGAGAPHLHFEIRDQNNRPTNPFYFSGNSIMDNSRPGFQAVWLKYLDDHSLFEGGFREKRLIPDLDLGSGNFAIRDTAVVTGHLAILAAIEDIVGRGSFVLGPSRITLHIDNRLYHEIFYDRIDFAENVFSILDKDSDPTKGEYKRVYNLYRRTGNRLSNYRSDAGDGTFTDTIAGTHEVLITAWDPSGNKATLSFAFYYFPQDRIISPLNRARISDTSMVLLLEPDHAPFDSVQIYSISIDGQATRIFPEIVIKDFSLNLGGDFGGEGDYQLMFFSGGIAYPSAYISAGSLTPIGQSITGALDYKILDGGLWIDAQTQTDGINWLLAEIISDHGSRRLFCQKGAGNRFNLYYRPATEMTSIEKILVRGPVGFRPDTISFDLRRIDHGQKSEIQLRQGVLLAFDRDVLFDDALLEIGDTIMPGPETGYYLYGPYIIGPEAYSFADWADLQTEIDDPAVASRAGLYVFDEDDGWLWAGGEYDLAASKLHSQLGGAGVVAVIVDTTGPVISQLNIKKNQSVNASRPQVRFTLSDELSGIENDLNFNVTVDDKWIVPEYDPERELFVSKPHWRLREGAHSLKIEVHDRCGNSTSFLRKFRVKANAGP